MLQDNTFLLNCQWYRYLVAVQNNISFTNVEQNRYERTWSTFGREFDRFVEYIDRKLSVCQLNTNWQSMKQAQFEISQMIRPILEAIRNILRNIILSRDSPTNQAIELQPTVLYRTASRCLSCNSNLSKIGKFWVISTVPHEIRNGCFTCSCTLMQHVPMKYLLQYQFSSQISTCTQYASKEMLWMLSNASAEFSYFLKHVAGSRKDDPVLAGLKEMINEERCIVTMQDFSMLNSELIEELTKSVELHQQQMDRIATNQKFRDLPTIYQLIKTVRECSIVREQLEAVKKTQQMIMEQYEMETRNISETCRW